MKKMQVLKYNFYSLHVCHIDSKGKVLPLLLLYIKLGIMSLVP